MKKILCIVALAWLLPGCSDEGPGAPPPQQGTVFDDQVDALRAAEDVGKTLDDAFDKRDEEMTRQGG